MGRFETEMLGNEENLRGLEKINGGWVQKGMKRTAHRRIILDMDSSESPVHGEQEGSAYNRHFGCSCYHPLFCFNQLGDWEGAMLRPGNVHSAECVQVKTLGTLTTVGYQICFHKSGLVLLPVGKGPDGYRVLKQIPRPGDTE